MIDIKNNEAYKDLILLAKVLEDGRVKVNSKLLKQKVYIYFDNNIDNLSLDLLNDDTNIIAYFVKDLQGNVLLNKTTVIANIFDFVGLDCKITK